MQNVVTFSKISAKIDNPLLKNAKIFISNTGCQIIISNDDGRLHLSISHKNRYPSWEEIFKARYNLLPPDINFAMALPAKKDYINIHNNCFHLWEEI